MTPGKPPWKHGGFAFLAGKWFHSGCGKVDQLPKGMPDVRSGPAAHI
jgi:hypothetical protein